MLFFFLNQFLRDWLLANHVDGWPTCCCICAEGVRGVQGPHKCFGCQGPESTRRRMDNAGWDTLAWKQYTRSSWNDSGKHLTTPEPVMFLGHISHYFSIWFLWFFQYWNSWILCWWCRCSWVTVVVMILMEMSYPDWSMCPERSDLVLTITKRLVPWMLWCVKHFTPICAFCMDLVLLMASQLLMITFGNILGMIPLFFWFIMTCFIWMCHFAQIRCECQLSSRMRPIFSISIAITTSTTVKLFERPCVSWWIPNSAKKCVMSSFLRDLTVLIAVIDMPTTTLCSLT